MNIYCFIVFLFFGYANLALAKEGGRVFRTTISDTPASLDPLLHRQSINSYLLNSIYRTLYSYRDDKLTPELVDQCVFKSDTQIDCTLKAHLKYSDGTKISAADFVRTFRRAFSEKALVTDALLSLRNGRKVLNGESAAETLGVESPSARKLTFHLERADREFLYNLIDPAFAPRPEAKLTAHFSGPFKVKELKKGKSVQLQNNPNFFRKNKRPDVEFLAVPDDDTALRLYETGALNLLRRLTADAISTYVKRPDFMFVPMLRFDYVGFGPQLKKQPEVRKALSLAVDYQSFIKLFNPRGRAGCVGLPQKFYTSRPCLSQNLKKIKEVSSPLLPLKFNYALAGGEDIRRQAEWFQGQWQKHAGIEVEIEGLEFSYLSAKLRTDPPDLFRRGVPLERPTCLAALEIFQKDNPNNFIKFDDPKFEKIIAQMRTAQAETKKKSLCAEATRILLDGHYIIPLGEIHYSMLKSSKFSGFNINSLNQLFLDALH